MSFGADLLTTNKIYKLMTATAVLKHQVTESDAS